MTVRAAAWVRSAHISKDGLGFSGGTVLVSTIMGLDSFGCWGHIHVNVIALSEQGANAVPALGREEQALTHGTPEVAKAGVVELAVLVVLGADRAVPGAVPVLADATHTSPSVGSAWPGTHLTPLVVMIAATMAAWRSFAIR